MRGKFISTIIQQKSCEDCKGIIMLYMRKQICQGVIDINKTVESSQISRNHRKGFCTTFWMDYPLFGTKFISLIR